MREILFRGKSLNAGNMVCGDLVCWDNGKVNIHVTMFDDKDKKYKFPVDPKTVGQFTGLYDKNGTKIFEGDIVKYCNDIGYINFNIGGYCIHDFDSENNPAIDIIINEFSIEVIGNIYDNPELVKEREHEICAFEHTAEMV